MLLSEAVRKGLTLKEKIIGKHKHLVLCHKWNHNFIRHKVNRNQRQDSVKGNSGSKRIMYVITKTLESDQSTAEEEVDEGAQP